MPAAIDAPWTPRLFDGVAFPGNDRHRTVILDVLPDFLAVVRLVRGHRQWRPGRCQDLPGSLAVVHLASREDEVQRPAFAIDRRMDFRAPPTTADADRLIFLPPFA